MTAKNSKSAAVRNAKPKRALAKKSPSKPSKRVTKAMVAKAINEAVSRIALPLAGSDHVAVSVEIASKRGFHLVRVPIDTRA